ncbi:MAG: acyl-CoA thioesterase [Sedimenticola sp.]|uniref:Acyl-CoA thioesterase n=1 Tax=Sedimenticola thiotaurini TaxID=1543721 RepID=A0A558DF26_9GAMM|nr:acyl-CoA thioesterase [Sedimenticola sp.]MCW8949550.1 acyl-CoA thioesterase [Sedimenticola sp.]TVT59629.1 MAG: acyl-CoA thioesterase [Sedimenticola thiotaurini]
MINNEWLNRDDYRYFYTIPTRWNDNDQFGHLNNVIYYRLYEALIVQYLTEAGLDWMKDPVIPYAAESLCRFRRAVSFPDVLDLGLRVMKVGRTSVVYAVAMFRKGEQEAAATGHWVHVYVDRESQQPMPVPELIRSVMLRDC